MLDVWQKVNKYVNIYFLDIAGMEGKRMSITYKLWALGVISEYLLNTQISEFYSIGTDIEYHQIIIYCRGF